MSNPNYSRSDARMHERIIRGLISRGTVEGIDDEQAMQQMRIALQEGHNPTQIEHWQTYGISFLPLQGSEVISFAVNGSRDHLVVMPAADPRYRVKNMQPGDMAVHDHRGQMAYFGPNGVRVVSDRRVDLGNEGGAAVMTTAGPSTKVFAIV